MSYFAPHAASATSATLRVWGNSSLHFRTHVIIIFSLIFSLPRARFFETYLFFILGVIAFWNFLSKTVVYSRCDVGAPVVLRSNSAIELCYKLALWVYIFGSFASLECAPLIIATWKLNMAQRTGFEENLDVRAMEEDGDESALDEREATDFRGREEVEQPTSRSEVSDLMMLMKAQLLAAEKLEERLDKMLKAAVSADSSAAASCRDEIKTNLG